MAVAVALGRFGGPQQLGIYVAVTASSALVVLVSTFALEAHVVARLSGKDSDRWVVASAMRASFAITLPLVLSGFFIVGVAVFTEVWDAVVFVALLEILAAPLLFTRPYLHARGRQRSMAMATISCRLFWAVGATTMALGMPEYAVLGAIGFRFLGTLLEALLLAMLADCEVFRNILYVRRRSDDELGVWGLLREASPLAVSGTATALNQRLDVLLIVALLGANSTGVYGAAAKLSEPFRVVGSSLYHVIAPAIVQAANANDFGAMRKAARDFAILLSSLTGLAATVLAALAPWVVPGLFGQGFVSAVPLVPVLVVAEVCLLVGLVSTSIALAIDRRRSIAWSASVAAGANAVANLIMIPQFGVLGAAFASLGSYAIAGFSVLIFDKRVREVGKATLRVSGTGVALTAFSIFLPWSLGLSPMIAPIVFVVAWPLLFPAAFKRGLRIVDGLRS